MESLRTVTETPATKRRRFSTAPHPPVHCEEGADDDPTVFFKFAFVGIGNKKQVRTPVGVGGRVSQGSIAIILHRSCVTCWLESRFHPM